MKVLWKGAISFGLVTIPVSLYPATRREELKFRLLRASDHSPVNYKRVAEADGELVEEPPRFGRGVFRDGRAGFGPALGGVDHLAVKGDGQTLKGL